MRIKAKDLPFLLVLMQYPIATNEELCKVYKDFTGSSIDQSTSSRKIRKLEKNGIISGVQAMLNYDKLDMELHSFIVSVNDKRWRKNMEIIDDLCAYHPYTIFKNEIYGSTSGIFIQFNVPKRSEVIKFLKLILDELVENDVLVNYKHIDATRNLMSSNGDLRAWDRYTDTWITDFKKINDILNEFHEPIYIKEEESILHELRHFDMAIIREFSKNMRRTQIEIMDSIFKNPVMEGDFDPYANYRDLYPTSKQTISRRIQFLEDNNLFTFKRLSYDRTKFGIFNQALFITDRDDVAIASLVDAIRLSYEITHEGKKLTAFAIPFPCSVAVSENKMLFWIHMPPVEIIKFNEILASRFTNVEFYLLGRHPVAYFFWNGNFNGKTWKVSKKYIYDDIRNILQKKIQA